MVRLLRRAKDRPADPDLYAGLTHACRYCGLMTASIAATEQARRLDPRIRTSGAHTHFMLGDYERVLDFQPETDPLHAQRRARHARQRRTKRGPLLAGIDVQAGGRPARSSRTRCCSTSRRARTKRSATSAQLVDIPDPEGRFYTARAMVAPGPADEAADAASQCVDRRVLLRRPHTRAIPWLDPVRGAPAFTDLLRRAEDRHRQARHQLSEGRRRPHPRGRPPRLIQSVVDRAGGSHRGPEPVQFQPANRVRAGRQQR